MALRYSTRTTTLALDVIQTRVDNVNALTSFTESDLTGIGFSTEDVSFFIKAIANLSTAESISKILNLWLPLNELVFKADEGLIFTRTANAVIQLGGGPVSTEAPATGSEEVGDTFIDTVNGNTFNFWNGTEFVTLQPSFGIFNSSGGQIWPV